MAAITARYDKEADGIALEGPGIEEGIHTISLEDATALAITLTAIVGTARELAPA